MLKRLWYQFSVDFYQYLDRTNRTDIMCNGNSIILTFAKLRFMGWWVLDRFRQLAAEAAENDYRQQ